MSGGATAPGANSGARRRDGTFRHWRVFRHRFESGVKHKASRGKAMRLHQFSFMGAPFPCALAITAILIALPAAAQRPPSGADQSADNTSATALQEIVVTAQK